MPDPMQINPESPSEISLMRQEALDLHEKGSLGPAEAIYKKILSMAPHDFTATHCLGVIRNQRGDYEAAVQIIGEALRINPRSAMAHLNLGIALWNLNRTEEALSHYQYSLVFQPGNPDALMNCAIALQAMGRQEEALVKLDTLLNIQADLPEGHLNRGIVLQGLLRHREAVESFDRAIALRPDCAVAFVNRGNALVAMMRLEEALGSYECALACDPENPEAIKNRGAVILHLKLHVREMIHQLERCINDGRYDAARWVAGNWLSEPGYRSGLSIILILLKQISDNNDIIVNKIRETIPLDLDSDLRLRLGSVFLSMIEKAYTWETLAEAILKIDDYKITYKSIHEKKLNCESSQRLSILRWIADYWRKTLLAVPKMMVTYYDELMSLFAGNLGDFDEADRIAIKYHEQILEYLKDKPDLRSVRYLGGDFLGMIGHIGLIDFHLKSIRLGLRDYTEVKILMDPGQFIANPDFLQCYGQNVEIVDKPVDPFSLPYTKEFVNYTTLENGKIVWWPQALSNVQKAWEDANFPPIVKLNDEKLAQGEIALREMGIPEGAWYVTMHVRDGSYRKDPGFDFRNSRFQNNLAAARAIVKAGGWVIRVGDAISEFNPEPGMVDYSRSGMRTPFLDIYLLAKSRFFLGTSSGLVMVPLAFGVPCIQVNIAPIAARAYSSHDLFLPKLYRKINSGDYLPFSEAMKPPLGTSFLDHLFEEAGIEAVDNSEMEIQEVTEEMIRRLNGKERDSDDDLEMQKRFNQASPNNWGGTGGRVGKAFLKRYINLL